jgi:hypothetical protein
MRGGLSARSASDTMTPSTPWTTSARAAAASQSFIEPHSSDSTWPKLTRRSRSSGMTRATAPLTRGNGCRPPQWNSSGSSATQQELVEDEIHGFDMGGQPVRVRGDLVDDRLHRSGTSLTGAPWGASGAGVEPHTVLATVEAHKPQTAQHGSDPVVAPLPRTGGAAGASTLRLLRAGT